MPEHTHVLTDNHREMSDVLRFINGISARRVIDYLKAGPYESSLQKLRIQERRDKYKYSLCEHHPNAIRVAGEDAFIQKMNYIHMNPVKAGLVEHPDDYLYSSSRQWHGRSLDNEPLLVDLKRSSGGTAASVGAAFGKAELLRK